MRLRYLNLAPLQKISIPFGQQMLGHNCATHFIIGDHGSGKSRLLRALTQLFLALEDGRPPFPVTLVYDLAYHPDSLEPCPRTIFLRYDGHSSNFIWRAYQPAPNPPTPITTPDDWQAYLQSFPEIPASAYGRQRSFLLPQTVLAYSSGLSRDWEALFAPSPLHTAMSETGYFVSTPLLKLALCAVALYQARQDLPATAGEAECAIIRQRVRAAMSAGQKTQRGLRGLLDEVGWLWPVNLTLTFDPSHRQGKEGRQWQAIYERLQSAATFSQNAPSRRMETLTFDLFNVFVHPERPDQDNRVLAAVIDAFQLDDEPVTAFDIFRQLYRWQTAGYLRELTLSLQKEGVNDLLLYDWLSDGEQMLLGRIALFCLLQDEQDALLILDEPETHFSDAWERRIVGIIDNSLHRQHHEVIIATHSSLVLSDALHTEITVLKNGKSLQPVIRTFGASLTEIMRSFGAPDSVGQRASEFLELLLLLAARPDDVEELWQDQDVNGIKDSPIFVELHQYIQAELTRASWVDLGDDDELKDRIADALVSVRAYTLENREHKEHISITVAEALDLLENKLLGAGYYQFEFGRRVRALRKRKTTTAGIF